MNFKLWWKSKGLAYLFAIILISAAFNHLIHPEFYSPLIPDWCSEEFANWFSFISEGLIGLFLIIKKTRKLAFLAFSILMIGFLPLHIWDALKQEPAMINPIIAWLRVGLQFYMIWLGFKMYQVLGSKSQRF